MSRRQASGLLAAFAAALGLPAPLLAAPSTQTAGRFGPPTPFSHATLVARAQALARRPYAAPAVSPHAVADFDTHVRLTYGAASELPGHVRLFPTRVGIAPYAVGISLVDNGQARALVDTHGLFGDGAAADPAGFRVMYPDGHADWLAFLGASYFRCEGTRNQYGLSARGVSVNTGQAEPEEFPSFTDFWLEAKGEDRLIIHALLDGPSITGAFSIDTRRDPEAMVQDITATLFLRRDVHQLGLAPMTSMFCFGEDHRGDRHDWRPEVHDSDGLAIWTGNGERIWRPLNNPAQPTTYSFRADHVKAFGLLQRDQNFDHYQDDLMAYDRRPSLWIEPKGDWGPGTVRLFGFPSISETVDNIGAFWVSDTPARAGQRRDLAYRLTWGSRDMSVDSNAHCIASYQGPGGVPGANPIDGATRYVFDFAGTALAGLDRSSGIRAVTDLPAGAVLLSNTGPVSGQPGVWRATLDVRTRGLGQNEFRLFLQRGAQALSETVIKNLTP